MRRTLILLSLLALPAQASPLEMFGVGLKGGGRGLANIAGADDLFATFYNPAGLMDVSSIEFAVVHQLNAPFLDLSLAKGAEVALAPAEPEVLQNTSFGFAIPLVGRLKNRATFGGFLEIPNGILVRAKVLDARRPHWVFYDSYPNVFSALAAIALRVFPGFDLALGMHMNTGLDGRITLELDPITNTLSQRELDFEFTGKMGPTIGLKLTRGPLHFGLVYRSPLNMGFGIPADMAMEGVDAGMSLQLRGQAHVMPQLIASGVEWRTKRFQCEASLQWKNWSAFPDPSLDAEIDLHGEDLDAFGLGSALDAPDTEFQPRQDPGFRDTVSAGVGASYRLGAWQTHVGYTYVPSPVPDQLHHTNLLDAHRHQVSASLIWTVQDPFGLLAKPLSFGFASQWQQFETRQVTKALGALDPIGNWTASGGVLSVNAGLSGRL